MALSLDSLVRKKSDKPPKIVIYGPGGVGKTTLAAGFPSAVFIQTEDGGGNNEVTSFSQEALSSFIDVKEALVALVKEDHDYKTLVVDSITRLEPIVWKHVCEQNDWNSIEDPGYGKGYVEADNIWANFLSTCTWLRDNKGMTIILIAHEAITTYSDPDTESYDRYQPRLHKRAEAMVREDCDILAFMNQVTTTRKEDAGFNRTVVKGSGSGQIALNTSPRPAFLAKTRFDMPAQILVNKDNGYSALASYLPSQKMAEAAQDAA